jgi:hypothetical protein
MLQVDNRSAFQVSLGVFPNEAGVECVYAVIKATFVMGAGGSLSLADPQEPVALVDEPMGEPLVSSLRTAGEMTLSKPATDVLLHGHAHAPGGKTTQVYVGLRVGPLQKTVRVTGDRTWTAGALGLKISDPKPFDRIPLVYERAFGGTDPKPIDPEKVDFEPRNPVGRGLVPRNSQADVNGLPLPNLEDPAHPIKQPKDRPAPAGFGPIAGHWQPRLSYAGTYDEAWTKKRAPYLPLDFDSRFFQAAPPDQIAAGYLKGGEPVEILNATPGGRLAFSLPVCRLAVQCQFGGREVNPAAPLDTVRIDTDAARLWLLWRACLVVDKKLLALTTLRVTCPEFPRKGA